MKPLSILAVLLVFPVSTLATVRTVPGDFATIQAAMNASSSGDEVVVAPGTYAENIVLTAVHSGVWLHSSSGPAATTIDGGLASNVITCTNVSAATTIEGFTITRGQASLGGGLNYVGSSSTIKNCIVRANVAKFGGGGGIYLNQGCNPTIVDSEFADNQAPGGSGGGIYSDNNCSPRIERCNIHNNTCADHGAGLVTGDFSNSVIINNEIHHNTASLDGGGAWFARQGALSVVNNRFYQNVGQSGGAMWIQGGGGTFGENQIYENRASTNAGGGIYCTTTNVTVHNNVFWSNAAHSEGGAIALSNGLCLVEGNTIVRNTAVVGAGISVNNFSGASNTLRRNIVAYQVLGGGIRGFGATFECNDVFQNAGGNYQGFADQTGLNGNISSDPLFCNLLSFDLTIAQGSPCVPANSPCGALIGALGPACGPIPTKQATWGAVKALYR